MNSRWLIILAGLFLISSCVTDPSAVTSFSAIAPDATKLHTLTVAYANVPDQLIAVDVMKTLSSENTEQLEKQAKERNQQITAIDALNTVLVSYMQSLGVLANNGLVQTSPGTTDVTAGLTALANAVPELRTTLTTNVIAGVGAVSTFLGDLVTSGYRQAQLKNTIAKCEAPFQSLISVEKIIVTKGIIPELTNIQDRTKRLAEMTHALEINASAEYTKASIPHQPTSEVDSLNPVLQGSGAADLASLLLLQRSITADLSALSLQIKAANEYVTALDNIAKAHTILYNNREKILTKDGAKSALTQLTPLVKDAYTALEALKNI